MLGIRKVNEGDSKDIFDWRNDALTRQMSHTTDLVEWDGHRKWFSSSLTNKNRLLVICEKKSTLEKVSVVRFDVEEGRTLVSINLNPNQRGKGLAKVSLIKSIDFFSENFTEAKRLVAEIKRENIGSQITFLGIGFEKYDSKDNIGFYEKSLVTSKMEIKFKKIIPTDSQIDELYVLLTRREYSISHKTIPSISEHRDFVSEHPYVVWYILSKNTSLFGSVYVQFDNSIGINLLEYCEKDILTVINHIRNNHKPLQSIKSVRRDEFFVNVASENTNLIKILRNMNKDEFQRSFIV